MKVAELNEIPELTGMTSKIATFALMKTMNGAGPKHTPTYFLVINMIRLYDILVIEYNLGRKQVEEYHTRKKNHGLSFIVAAAGHFENCILGLERLIRITKRIRSDKSISKRLKTLIPKGMKLLLQGPERKISEIRHMVEHLEEKLNDSDFQAGTDLTLFPGANGLTFGTKSIRYQEIHSYITEAGAIMDLVIQYSE